MSADVLDLVPLTSRSVERLYTAWLQPYIQGLSIEPADRKAYANHLVLTLTGDLPCACRRRLCSKQHTLAALPTSGKTLRAFVFRAIIGPVGLKTVSIAQGMLFPYLHQEYGLRVGLVAFKRCPQPACQQCYEGATCPYCQTPFQPDNTAIISVERLVLAGERGYLPVQYWRCGSGVHTHFYPQTLGQGGGEHASTHDCCPWQGCPQGNPPHGQRSTTLWVRAKFLRG